MSARPPDAVTQDPADRVRVLALELIDALLAVAEARLDGPPQPDTMYSLPEAARLLGISETSLKRARKRGDVRAMKVGRRQLITSGELRRVQRELET